MAHRVPWFRCHRANEPRVNRFTPEKVGVWLMFDPRSGLDLEEAGEDSIGSPPDWYDSELSEAGWECILDVPFTYDAKILWMLGEGIAPSQPFFVEVGSPTYSEHWTDCGYEHDVDYDDVGIVRVLPMTSKKAAAAWEQELKAHRQDRQAMQERKERRRYLMRTEVKSMFVRHEAYFAPGQSFYDDMECPAGVRYSLCSCADIDGPKPFPTAYLARGEDHDGDHERAMQRLIESATKTLPGLSSETIKNFPRRQ